MNPGSCAPGESFFWLPLPSTASSPRKSAASHWTVPAFHPTSTFRVRTKRERKTVKCQPTTKAPQVVNSDNPNSKRIFRLDYRALLIDGNLVLGQMRCLPGLPFWELAPTNRRGPGILRPTANSNSTAAMEIPTYHGIYPHTINATSLDILNTVGVLLVPPRDFL